MNRRTFGQANFYLNQLYKLMMLGHVTQKTYNAAKQMTVPQQKKVYNRYKGKTSLKATDVQRLKKQVRDIKKHLDVDLSTHTHKRTQSSRCVTAAVNEAAYETMQAFTRSALESALAGLRYYDPSNPTVLVTADGSSGTFQREMLIPEVYTRTECRNNYLVPCKVSISIVVPKKDTSIGPETAMVNGLTDQGNPSLLSTVIYPSDADQFNDLWSIKKTITRVLAPGQSMSTSYSVKDIQYDSSFVDSHALAWQKDLGAHAYLYRVHGVVGHDTTTQSQVGLLDAGVDITLYTKTVIKYDSNGGALNDISLNDGYDTFTLYGVVTNKPAAQNQQEAG